MLQYAILGVALMYFLLGALLHVGGRTHENRFILGFGVASLAAAFGGRCGNVWREFCLGKQGVPIAGYLIALMLCFRCYLSDSPVKRQVARHPGLYR